MAEGPLRCANVLTELAALTAAHGGEPYGPRRLIRVYGYESGRTAGRDSVLVLSAEAYGSGPHLRVSPGPSGTLGLAGLAHLASRPRTLIALADSPIVERANSGAWTRPYRMRTAQALALLAQRLDLQRRGRQLP